MRVQLLRFGDGRAVLVEEVPEAVVGPGGELSPQCFRVWRRLRQWVLGDGEGEAGAGAADGGHAAVLVLVAGPLGAGAGAGCEGGIGGEG